MALVLYLNQSIFTIISNINFLGKGSGWIIDSVIDHNINISKFIPLAGNSFIELPKELDHPRKGLINIENIGDNTLIKYLNPAYHQPTRITKADNDFSKRLHFKNKNFQ